MDFPALVASILTVIVGIPGAISVFYKIKPGKDITAKGLLARTILWITLGITALVWLYCWSNSNPHAFPPVTKPSETIPSETTPITQSSEDEISLTRCTLLGDSNSSGSISDVCAGTWIDVHGNIYHDAIRFWVWDAPGMSAAEHVLYQLDKPYSTLMGTFAAERSSASGAEFKFNVYLDGELCYESSLIDTSSPPSTFSIDVSGATAIRIECTTSCAYSGYCIISATLS